MMKKHVCFLIATLLFFSTLSADDTTEYITLSDSFQLAPITPSVYVHISEQSMAEFGKFTSNGLVYIHNGEAVIMDTPPEDARSQQLIDWINTNWPGIRIKGVVINHFHADCLGGLSAFHKAGIPSYATTLTQKLAKEDKAALPQHVFDGSMVLDAGGSAITVWHPGEAHSRDNTVTWIADERVLFGGCMIKAVGAGKGNLASANMSAWAATVKKVKKRHRKARIIVPGHGRWGDKELLDYTINMFRQ